MLLLFPLHLYYHCLLHHYLEDEDIQDNDVVENGSKDAREITEASVPESATYTHVDVRL